METAYRKYAPLWNKYRPAILRMMVDAASEPQQYRLMQHEFAAADDKKKTSYSFNLQVAESKPVNNIKNSEAAQDLLHMLQLSRKGAELIEANAYEITMDKQFMLHVSQVETSQEEETVEAPQES